MRGLGEIVPLTGQIGAERSKNRSRPPNALSPGMRLEPSAMSCATTESHAAR
jgi:hypothetical protein